VVWSREHGVVDGTLLQMVKVGKHRGRARWAAVRVASEQSRETTKFGELGRGCMEPRPRMHQGLTMT
jgi:hypothetical protein